MKFCKDCKHYMGVQFIGGYAKHPATCNHPDLLDCVDGRGTPPYLARSYYGKCGEAARLFEQKPPEPEKRNGLWSCLFGDKGKA